ncbi:ABC transporter permease subunit [Halomonas sp. MCCC 1A17488]|uniref:ABC transporter permease subunit n=1 Tax=Billgrantia sulfidoxydans TaxID=2733484 RepID=A0ABX7W8V3_9GAMM|nr:MULTISPECIES: ABC transporter permease subunit [Halomonas]MCE8018054.1 ABC transporter permease subunit [Halomonas sp. MCCC 1A17488]MCG3241387.1 ABC transporter permease subunit [Halomonas sp. MCCC 1A17488]QPP48650.1 ABC transporter permease subunit [Halomonas sp. SS10-MC5]QTP55992.1 ABC transporter permease subunit [Halomonas sulfidoxydans]
MLRLAPLLIVTLLVGPILAGLTMALLPAFGYLPALGGERLSLAPWRELFAQPGLARSVAVSFASGLVTTAVSLAVVLLFLASVSGSRLDRWIRRMVAPLLSLPHAAAAFGLAFLIAPSGLLARLVSPELSGWQRPPDLLIVNDPWGLTLMAGLVVKEIPFLLLMSLAALPQFDPERRVAMARSLGYRPMTAWLKVVVPALYPLIRLPVYAVIAYATAVVDVALILGPTLPPTLAVSILAWYQDPDLSRRLVASAGAVLQLGVTASALAVWWCLEGLVARLGRAWLARGGRGQGEQPLRLAGKGLILLASLTAFVGLAGLALSSIAGLWRFPDALPQAVTAAHWLRALPTLAGPVATTALIAIGATLIALALTLAALENEQRSGRHPAEGKLLSALTLLYLPLIVPQIAFLFGLVVVMESLGTRPRLWLVIFGHLLFVLPYVFLSLSEAYRRFDPRWSQLALSLGTSRHAVFWRVRLPMLLAPLLTAGAVGLAVSIGQYLPTLLLGAGRIATVTTEAVSLAAGGNRRVIGVWALVQASLPLVGFLIAVGLPRLLWSNRRGMRGSL